MGDELRRHSPLTENLPEDWTSERLDSVCSKIGTGATPRGGQSVYLAERTNYALVRSQNVFDRYFSDSGLAFIDDEAAQKLRAAEIQAEDVLLNITGDGITFARSCIMQADELPACVNQHVAIIRTKGSRCVPGFLLSVLTHPWMKEYIKSFNAGGSRRAITKGHIESFEIPLPPLPEQKAIAYILGSLDDKIELNQKMNASLEAMAQALFNSWFIDFDPVIDNALAAGNPIPEALADRAEVRRQAIANGTANREAAKAFPDSFKETEELGWIPEGWEVGQISELFELHRGFDLSANKRTHGSYPVYSAGGIHGVHNEYKMDPPGIITGRSGVIGNVYLSLTRYWPLNTTLYVRSFRKCGPFYALHFLRRLDLKAYNSGSAVPSLNRNYVHSSDTFIPSNEALEVFELFLADLYKKIKVNDEESKQLTKLRDTLLPKLISGELRISDAKQLTEEALA